jgi:(2Fe-2S) ferredoxin
MARFDHHVFVCTNERPAGHPKGCCAADGGREVRSRFKEELERRGLRGRVRANAAGCLDLCECGVTVVVYPDEVWYGRVTVDDVAEIVERHLVGGEPVERLRIPPSYFESGGDTSFADPGGGGVAGR